MAKEKKPLTIKQQANRYRNIRFGCIGAEFLSAIAPFVTVGLVNYNKYFVEYDGTKMSFAFVIACALMGFAVIGITTKKLENTYVSFIIKWAIVATIFTLLGQIINDIAMIMWYGLIGLVGAQGFEIGAQKAKAKQKNMLEAINQAQKEMNVEQAKEEIVKVRIK